MQRDGNLVLYNSVDAPLWASGTDGSGAAYACMQRNGEFVIETDDLPPRRVWASNSLNHCQGPYKVAMQDDGNFVQYDTNGTPVWCTRTDGGQQGCRSGGVDHCGNSKPQPQ